MALETPRGWSRMRGMRGGETEPPLHASLHSVRPPWWPAPGGPHAWDDEDGGCLSSPRGLLGHRAQVPQRERTGDRQAP